MNKFIWGAYFLAVCAAPLSQSYGSDFTTAACVAVAFMLGLSHD